MGLPERVWYRPRGPLAWLLAPLSALFCSLVGLRRFAYRHGWLRVAALPVPVIVIGNITVGGTGKTPLVAAVVELLIDAGWRPGIISRGYGGQATEWPQAVSANSDPHQVGDEPVLLAAHTGRPLVVGPDRVAAAERLLRDGDVDIVISDDGLQHYRLPRNVEIAVVDGDRRLGNGFCLPAGPLRETAARLDEVDWVVTNGPARAGEFGMTLSGSELFNLADPQRRATLEMFAGHPVHAVAGIGHPERFFAMLRRAGLEVFEHPFPDHHPYRADDLEFDDTLPVIMTEKDAVKCRVFAREAHWYLPVSASLPPAFAEALTTTLQKKR